MGLMRKEFVKNGGYYEVTTTTLEKDKSRRGLINFTDRCGQACTLQDSALATEACIWIGVENTGPYLTGPTGQYNEQVNKRMELTQAMVKQLLPFLIEFAETGEYIANMKIPKAKTPKKKTRKKK